MKKMVCAKTAFWFFIFMAGAFFSCKKESSRTSRIESRTKIARDKQQFVTDIDQQSPIAGIQSVSGCSKVEYECVDWYLVTYNGSGDIVGERYLGKLRRGFSQFCHQEHLPRKFNFVTVTTNGVWQEAAVINIHFNIASTDRNTPSRRVVLPTMYFGMPTRYSPRQAAVNAARAVHEAESRAYVYARDNPSKMDYQIAAFWIEQINILMGEYSGKAGKQGSINPSQPVSPTQNIDGC